MVRSNNSNKGSILGSPPAMVTEQANPSTSNAVRAFGPANSTRRFAIYVGAALAVGVLIAGVATSGFSVNTKGDSSNSGRIGLTKAPTVISIRTPFPTFEPTSMPTDTPNMTPTNMPSDTPSSMPTLLPTDMPTFAPTNAPSTAPTNMPTVLPTSTPTIPIPSAMPSFAPSVTPSDLPSALPTRTPTNVPTGLPSKTPTLTPTSTPSKSPTSSPSKTPTLTPTSTPSKVPTKAPTLSPRSCSDGLDLYLPYLAQEAGGSDRVMYINCKRTTVGSIPSNIGTYSGLLGIVFEEAAGLTTLATQLGMLSNLKHMVFISNPDLTGTIPTQLGNMAQLTEMYFFDQRNEGSLPSELGKLKNLASLMIQGNSIAGSLPSEYDGMDSLTELGVMWTSLTGTLPSGLFSRYDSGALKFYYDESAVTPQ